MDTPSHSNKFFLFLTVLALVVSPAYAVTNTTETYTVHDQPYIIFQEFIVMFGLGIIFMILSFVLDKERNADAFAAMAIIPLAISAWAALRIDYPTKVVVTEATGATLWTNHNVYPSIFLAIFAFVLCIISGLQLYRLMTSGKPDGGSSGSRGSESEGGPEDDEELVDDAQ